MNEVNLNVRIDTRGLLFILSYMNMLYKLYSTISIANNILIINFFVCWAVFILFQLNFEFREEVYVGRCRILQKNS
ncbi:protein of unknown function [Candidatus Nitrosocosmicus franklandus]|uniref:Uncharacterized protein n=1 Tax=Candidatus Nitrosocosmicus franklandianus TaxID=1798806 RepID=A0A484IG06_9ARCH|nr:protein of unknown function [Candidatus Nitrosocosmicus franklandus]